MAIDREEIKPAGLHQLRPLASTFGEVHRVLPFGVPAICDGIITGKIPSIDLGRAFSCRSRRSGDSFGSRQELVSARGVTDTRAPIHQTVNQPGPTSPPQPIGVQI